MKYQIGIYDPGAECWRLHREDFKLITFDDLAAAEAQATKLSEDYSGRQVLVITVHCGFKTQTEYPRPEPIRKTERITVS